MARNVRVKQDDGRVCLNLPELAEPLHKVFHLLRLAFDQLRGPNTQYGLQQAEEQHDNPGCEDSQVLLRDPRALIWMAAR